jgi:uncharacterized membrane protein (UPF0136 family)
MKSGMESGQMNRVAVTACLLFACGGFLVSVILKNPLSLIAGVLIGLYLLFAIKVAQQW